MKAQQNLVTIEPLKRPTLNPAQSTANLVTLTGKRSAVDFKSIELGPKQNFILTSLEIGLSSNCNFRCDYCCAYNFNDKKFMTAQRVIEIINEAPQLKRVKLSGGEVLIYFDECVEVVKYCNSRGIQTQINTNGSLLTQERIEALEDAGLQSLHISLNFTNSKEFCAYYNQSERIFERIIDVIRLSAASSIETIVESVIFKRTEDTLVDIHHYLHGLGVRKHEIQNGIPIQKNDWEEVLPRKRVEEVIERLVENRHPEITLYFSCIDIDPQGSFYRKALELIALGNIHFPSCVEGRNQLHVHSNGDVLICELGHPIVIGNLNTGTRLNTLLTDKPQALVEFLERRSADKCSCTIRTLVQPS